jgi:hypothetical protein
MKVSPPSSPSPNVSLSRLVQAVRRGLQAEFSCEGAPADGVLEVDEIPLARQHRLEGFLSKHQDYLNLSGTVSTLLSASALNRAHQGLVQWAESISVSRVLGEHAIAHVVFKGRALTLQTFADDEGRGGGDLDVLVEPKDVPLADSLLSAHGYLPVYAVGPRSSAGWAFVTYRNREMPYRSSRAEVDLHWRIASEPDLLPPTSVLIARSVKVGRHGQEIPTLSPADALAACAVHFYLDYAVSLRRLIDFLRLSRLAEQSILHHLPAPSQQLIADVAAFCRDLFGENCVALTGLRNPDQANVSYIKELFWAGHGGYSHIRAGGTALSRLVRNYQHLGRYAGKTSLLLRLLARGILWFPPMSPTQTPIGILQAIWLQLGRVLRGRYDSEI